MESLADDEGDCCGLRAWVMRGGTVKIDVASRRSILWTLEDTGRRDSPFDYIKKLDSKTPNTLKYREDGSFLTIPLGREIWTS